MSEPPAGPQPDWGNPVHLLAFGLGTGASPYAPGTVGTLLGIPLYWLLAPLGPGWYLAAVLVLFVGGVLLCGRTSRDLGVHDHPGIVWDEILGYLITMAFAPPGWLWVLLGFIAFRGLDIWKPWPIRWVDRRVEGGLGIMLDDVLAGIYAMAALQVAAALMP